MVSVEAIESLLNEKFAQTASSCQPLLVERMQTVPLVEWASYPKLACATQDVQSTRVTCTSLESSSRAGRLTDLPWGPQTARPSVAPERGAL